ncbi:SDR family oxidoreductase [Kitasatospora cineracea]|uniref:SDR family oxidoreductase n=1 Tax=Kitasatospora cineracea TaxID=88074 RepID=UPI00340A8600
MTVLVTGSRGRVGSLLVEILAARGTAVRAGSSDPEKLTIPAGVDAVRLDLTDPETFAPALAGVDAVFLYCEPAHIGAFTAAAEAAGVEHVVVMSADAVLRADAASNPIAAPHLAVERALRASALTVTTLNCGALASNAGSWQYVLRARGAVTLPFPDSYADPIYEQDIAESAAAVLARPELRGRAYHLTGPESLSFRQQVAVIGAVVGREIPVQQIPAAVWRANKPGFMPDDIADALIELWTASDRPVPLSGDVETLTGHPARPFSAWAEDHAAAFAA